MLREAVCFESKHSYACEELYEVHGGDQVDGSPPAPISPFILRKQIFRTCSGLYRVCQFNSEVRSCSITIKTFGGTDF
eukprot:9479730-Pyramimonas_sp.AAC.1